MSNNKKIDEQYWKDYDGLQHTKHQLLAKYLQGWFPILGFSNPKILYIDTHAGKGRHTTGDEGSPLIALNTFLKHRSRDKILNNSEVVFLFFEYNQKNCRNLKRELSSIDMIPSNLKITEPICEDFERNLSTILDNLDSEGNHLAPSFSFLDPYGFKLPLELINRILSYRKCEVFINFMFRYIDMAIRNPNQVDNMNNLFGSDNWKEFREIDDFELRIEKICELYIDQLNAAFVSKVKMFGEHKELKYVLFHGTNHPKGWWLMKDVIWKVIPDGSFGASEKNRPEQTILIRENPDMRQFEKDVRNLIINNPMMISGLYKWMEDKHSPYLIKHLHDTIRKWRNEGLVECSGYSGKFSFNQDPLIKLIE